MTAISRVSGLARDMAISAVFGTGAGADAFFVAFRLPNLFRRIAAEGTASTAIVPVLTRRLVSRGHRSALQAAASVGGATIVVLAMLSALGVSGAGPFTDALAPGLAADPAKRHLAVSLTAWMFPYLLLVGTSAWAMGTLHTFRRFALPALGPILLNASIIAAALLVAPRIVQPEYALAAGVLIGGLLQVGIQLPALAALGMSPAMLGRVRHGAVREAGPLLLAAVFGGAVYQLNILVATLLASLLPAGSISFLWYADRVVEFPLGIVAVAVGTAALPHMASHAEGEDWQRLRGTIVHSVSLTLAWCLPAAVGLFLLAPDIVSLLLERGRFDPRDSAMTAWAVQAYVPGLLGVALVRVLSAPFYALGRPRVPVLAALLTLLCNAGLALALMGPPEAGSRWWGSEAFASLQNAIAIADLRHAGLALATGLASTINALVLLAALRGQLKRTDLAAVLASLVRHGAAAAVMAAAVVAARAAVQLSSHDHVAARVGVSVIAGVVAYVAAARLAGSREIAESVDAVRDRLRPS